MTRNKLFILSLIGFLLIPVYWVASSTYERYQIASKAEVLFNEIPTYPGSVPVEKSLSFYNIGYGYTYKTSDTPDKVLDFYKRSLIEKWDFEQQNDVSNSKTSIYRKSGDELKLSISIWKSGSPDLSSPPYDLTISVYKP